MRYRVSTEEKEYEITVERIGENDATMDQTNVNSAEMGLEGSDPI